MYVENINIDIGSDQIEMAKDFIQYLKQNNQNEYDKQYKFEQNFELIIKVYYSYYNAFADAAQFIIYFSEQYIQYNNNNVQEVLDIIKNFDYQNQQQKFKQLIQFINSCQQFCQYSFNKKNVKIYKKGIYFTFPKLFVISQSQSQMYQYIQDHRNYISTYEAKSKPLVFLLPIQQACKFDKAINLVITYNKSLEYICKRYSDDKDDCMYSNNAIINNCMDIEDFKLKCQDQNICMNKAAIHMIGQIKAIVFLQINSIQQIAKDMINNYVIFQSISENLNIQTSQKHIEQKIIKQSPIFDFNYENKETQCINQLKHRLQQQKELYQFDLNSYEKSKCELIQYLRVNGLYNDYKNIQKRYINNSIAKANKLLINLVRHLISYEKHTYIFILIELFPLNDSIMRDLALVLFF